MPAAPPQSSNQPGDSAKKKPQSRRRRRFFVVFKWCRIAVLLVVFIAIILGLFLNHVGLPGWVEAQLQQQIEEQGWKVDFGRLRLRWYLGIVAEDLVLHRTNTMTGPHLFVRNAEFRPDWKALRNFRLQSEGVALKDGRLIWPLPGTNQSARTFVLNQVNGELVFRPDDTWELRFLEATSLGTRVRFRGEVTNASALSAWKMPRPSEKSKTPPGEVWHRLLTDLEKLRFNGTPSAQVIVQGDARDWRGFDVNVRLTAPGVQSPWGGGSNVTAVAHTIPPEGTNDPIRLALQIGAEAARTEWADAARLDLKLQIAPSMEHLLPTNGVLSAHLEKAVAHWGSADRLSIEARCRPEGAQGAERRTDLEIAGERLDTRWFQADRLSATVSGHHGATKYLPARLETAFTADRLRTPWVTSHWSQVEFRADLPPLPEFNLLRTNRVWAWIDRITNLPFHVTATVSNAFALGQSVDRANVTADWQSPAARILADLSSGEAAISAGVRADSSTRRIAFTNTASLRPSSFARFLSAHAQRWLAEFDSLQTPSIAGGGQFVLPTWTSWPTNWHADVLPSLELAGRLEALSASFRGVEFVGAYLPFSLTNQVWGFSDLRMTRPEGDLRLNARADEKTGAFQVSLVSRLNPLALQPGITNAEPVFRLFALNGAPPEIEGQLSGNWRDWSKLDGTANVRLTNLVFRGVPIDGVSARLTYSNQWLAILEPVLVRPGERATADGIGIDFVEPRLYLTNAVGRLSPLALAQAIGPVTKRTIEPYVFEAPPNARVEGSVPLGGKNKDTENMRFEIDGGRFHWNVLHFERLKGNVIWQGDHLTLTNVSGLWHDGPFRGWVYFDFKAPRGGFMSYDASFERNDLKHVVRDFQRGRTNRLEGTISGRLRVTSADLNDLKSWDGYGRLEMQEGLVWDIPIFGLFSPVLNTFMPGLGNSRAKEGRATFTMTNSVIYTRNLEIVANATRLRYQGNVDFDGNVSAQVEAGLMREVKLVGPLISTIFWPVTKILKYSVSGTLAKPKLEPANVVASVLTLPFMPFKALNEILTPEKREKEKEKELDKGKETDRDPKP